MEVEDLPAGCPEGREVGPGSLQDVLVLLHAELHPVAEGVVGHVVEGGAGEGGAVTERQVPDYPFGAQTADAQFPGRGGGVVGGGCLVEGRGWLVGEVGALAGAVDETVDDFGGDGDTLSGNGAVLSGGRCCGHLLTFSEACS